MSKERLDVLLVNKGIVESRNIAQRLVMAGQVRVNGQVTIKPATMVDPLSVLEVDQGPRFVSRGGEKLAAAFFAFQIETKGLICADVGASTGGFSDCLLQNEAKHIFAIDVGKGILHWKIRQDPRVTVMENTNARYVQKLPEPINLVTIDASFISLRILLPVVKNWFPGSEAGGEVVALIKPQFEAGRKEASRGEGVIRDTVVHQRVIMDLLEFSQQEGFQLRGLLQSPILGPKGNKEFFTWLRI